MTDKSLLLDLLELFTELADLITYSPPEKQAIFRQHIALVRNRVKEHNE